MKGSGNAKYVHVIFEHADSEELAIERMVGDESGEAPSAARTRVGRESKEKEIQRYVTGLENAIK